MQPHPDSAPSHDPGRGGRKGRGGLSFSAGFAWFAIGILLIGLSLRLGNAHYHREAAAAAEEIERSFLLLRGSPEWQLDSWVDNEGVQERNRHLGHIIFAQRNAGDGAYVPCFTAPPEAWGPPVDLEWCRVEQELRGAFQLASQYQLNDSTGRPFVSVYDTENGRLALVSEAGVHWICRQEPGAQASSGWGTTTLGRDDARESYSTIHGGEVALLVGQDPREVPRLAVRGDDMAGVVSTRELLDMTAMAEPVQVPPLELRGGDPRRFKILLFSAVGGTGLWLLLLAGTLLIRALRNRALGRRSLAGGAEANTSDSGT